MKKLMLVSVVFAAALAGGCLFDDDDDGGGVKAEKWLALSSGAECTFERSDVVDGVTEKVVLTMNSNGSATVNGTTYRGIVSKYPDHADTLLVRTSGDIAYGFFNQIRAEMNHSMPGAASGGEVTLLKFGKKAGDTWVIYDSGQLLGGSSSLAGKYVGTESVTVPAGTYADCAVFDLTLVQSMLVSGGATVVTTTVSRLWFAPDIGLVKRTETVIRNDGTSYITQRTTTIEMKSRAVSL